MLLKSLIILLGVSWAFTKDVSNGTGIEPPFPPNGPPEPHNSTTITPVTTTSTSPPSPNSTTTLNPTTPSPISTTTSEPTTLSPNITTSTTTTTSTTSATTTTTSSTTAAPTTPTPKPDNNPAVNDYFGNYTNTEYICVMARIQIQVEVLTKDKKKSTVVNVPKAATSQVSCSPSSNNESLTINWYNNNITFQLLKNNNKFNIESIKTTISLPGSNATTYYHKRAEFSVSDKMSYYCTKEQLLNLTGDQSNETLALLHLSHFHYQGFMNTTKTNDYSSVWDCDGANTSDAVPVVVGCVLAVLVVLVLAAYLVGRRRCQARGYLSM